MAAVVGVLVCKAVDFFLITGQMSQCKGHFGIKKNGYTKK